MRITIYDIARKANVGVGTVSRVLNNHPSVSQSTREHVLSIARELDYHPNASAQRLARKKSRTVTVIMPFIGNYFFMELLGGIQDTLYRRDYDLLLYGVNHPKQIEGYLHRSLRVGHADGILLASMDVPIGYTQKCLRDNFPLIMIDRFSSNFDSFSVENVSGGRIATDHLLRLGHRRIAMITGTAETIPSRERMEGYRSVIASRADVKDVGIFHPETHTMNDGFNKDAGFETMQRILALPQTARPTGVFVASDIQAIGALDALKLVDIACPDEMSIISFDDIELSKYYALTTMRQHIHEIGVLATERLFERLDEPRAPAIHRQFTPELIMRHTTAPPAGR